MKDFTLRKTDGLGLLVCEQLEAAGFLNAFSTRYGGVSPLPDRALNLGNFSQDDAANILENRNRLMNGMSVSGWPLVTAQQIHSADLRIISDLGEARRPAEPGDALASGCSEILLAIQTADCLPLLLADTRSGAIAAVHAGWRGTLAGIVARTVKSMQQRFATRPADLLAALGPAIGQCCFEVGSEVVTSFRNSYSYVDQLITSQQDNGKAHFDLGQANIRQLLDAGLRAEAIFDCKLCTVCQNDRFFSYRHERGAERPVGRLMGVIGRRNLYEATQTL